MKKNHVPIFFIFFYINVVKANIVGNNKEYQYCRNKRKNVETMGGGNITPTHVGSYKQSCSIRPNRMHLSISVIPEISISVEYDAMIIITTRVAGISGS